MIDDDRRTPNILCRQGFSSRTCKVKVLGGHIDVAVAPQKEPRADEWVLFASARLADVGCVVIDA